MKEPRPKRNKLPVPPPKHLELPPHITKELMHMREKLGELQGKIDTLTKIVLQKSK